MSQYVFPALYTIFVWWLGTAIVLLVVSLPRRTFWMTMLGATATLAVSLYALRLTSADASVTGAYLAFSFAVLAWGWLELSYFLGYVTGPRQAQCPRGSSSWRRFVLAIQASLYHELAIITLAAAILAVTWEAPNQTGLWTFLILWVMRWSAKLNLFFGVPNLNVEFFPEHMRYLESYIAKRRMNLLFPVVITVSTAVVTVLLLKAFSTAAGPFEATVFIMLGVLLSLAILEHWFLVLPLADAALWNWALRPRGSRRRFDPAPVTAARDASRRPPSSFFSFARRTRVGDSSSCGGIPPRPAPTIQGRSS